MKTMTAKYPGVCRRTGAKIHPGDKINFFGRGRAELVQPDNEGFAGGDEFEEGHDEDAAGLERGTLANDRRLAKRGLSVIRFSSGETMTQNSRGRCEDAPCCGCCS